MFWESSVLEVSDMIDGADRLREADIRLKLESQFTTADLIANRISQIFTDSKTKIRTLHPWDVYPDLFEDKSDEIEEQRQLKETAEFKNDLYAFAARWNKRNEGK